MSERLRQRHLDAMKKYGADMAGRMLSFLSSYGPGLRMGTFDSTPLNFSGPQKIYEINGRALMRLFSTVFLPIVKAMRPGISRKAQEALASYAAYDTLCLAEDVINSNSSRFIEQHLTKRRDSLQPSSPLTSSASSHRLSASTSSVGRQPQSLGHQPLVPFQSLETFQSEIRIRDSQIPTYLAELLRTFGPVSIHGRHIAVPRVNPNDVKECRPTGYVFNTIGWLRKDVLERSEGITFTDTRSLGKGYAGTVYSAWWCFHVRRRGEVVIRETADWNVPIQNSTTMFDIADKDDSGDDGFDNDDGNNRDDDNVIDDIGDQARADRDSGPMSYEPKLYLYSPVPYDNVQHYLKLGAILAGSRLTNDIGPIIYSSGEWATSLSEANNKDNWTYPSFNHVFRSYYRDIEKCTSGRNCGMYRVVFAYFDHVALKVTRQDIEEIAYRLVWFDTSAS